MSIYENSLFWFGEHEEECNFIYSDNGKIKYTRMNRSFLNKVFDVYHLKREIRKLKTYLSVKDEFPLKKTKIASQFKIYMGLP
jgi:hypothetical protein